MKIAVDAMGGDYAPGVVIEAVQSVLHEIPDVELILVGHLPKLSYYLERFGIEPSPRLELVHAETVVEMWESSTLALRSKKNSSITVCADLVKAGRAQAIVSAGHTGAAVAATKVRLRTLPGIDRPALATLMPSLNPSGKSIVIDVGANTECMPVNLAQFAIMGDIYSKFMLNLEKPRVGLISVGGEDVKGNDLTKAAFSILSKMPNINFIGNVEGNDVFAGTCDVIICDGFCGNVLLKASEGLARATFQWLKTALKKNAVRFAGAILAKDAFKDIKALSDSEEYGGAPLLGINGICIIGHGASSPKAIKNAIRVSYNCLKSRLNDQIIDRIKEAGVDSPNGSLLKNAAAESSAQ